MVEPSFERGAALLRAPDGGLVRLSWEEPGAERRRELPPGRYELVGYRLLASDGRATWHVSASAVKGFVLELRSGRTRTLALDPTVTLEERVQPDGLSVTVLGERRAGLSLYEDGKRIRLSYRRLDARGSPRGEGELRYG